MQPMLNMAVRAARRAGTIITRALEKRQDLEIESKAKNDFVTEVDRQAEATIISILHKAYPKHAFLAEESGAQHGDDYQWIIDPLDGTTNFLHGNPQFCVSIALKHKDFLEHAVIYDPLRDELYTASRGKGAYFNDRRIRVTSAMSLEDTLLGTGFPFKFPDHLNTYLNTFTALHPLVSDIRRAGSAALDLAYVAAGRLDGFWELGLNPWDMAAGVLLIQEAGGFVSDFSGGDQYMKTGNIVAGNPKVHQAILQVIRPHLTEGLKK